MMMGQHVGKKRISVSAAVLAFGTLLVLSIGRVTPATAKPANAVDSGLVAAIAAANVKYELALEKGDTRAAIAPYEPSAIFIGPGPRILIGRTQIQAHIAKILTKAHFISGTCRTDHLSQDDNQAYEAGHCNSIVEINGRKAASGGDYLTVWRRQSNGTWLIEINAAP